MSFKCVQVPYPLLPTPFGEHCGRGTHFFQKAQESETMKLTDDKASDILRVHHALWNAVYDTDSSYHSLQYCGQTYTIQKPPTKQVDGWDIFPGYASVLLPNSKGSKFMWITQNLHKSTYGTLAIKRAQEHGEDHRITWVVDTKNGGFEYRSNITTTSKEGILIYGAIEIYDDLGKEIVWSTNKAAVTREAEF